MTPAFLSAEQEVEEPPSEVVTVETAPYLRRESRRRRSSYAFSHREGYAELITQGTILRRGPGADSDMLAGQVSPSDGELPLSTRSSPWHPKTSFPGKKGRVHRDKVFLQEEQPGPSVRSFLAAEARPSVRRPSASHASEPRPSGGARPPGSQPAPLEEETAPRKVPPPSWRDRPSPGEDPAPRASGPPPTAAQTPAPSRQPAEKAGKVSPRGGSRRRGRGSDRPRVQRVRPPARPSPER